jgi:signal transduction histidine kinase
MKGQTAVFHKDKTLNTVVFGALILAGLYITSLYSYLLFHSLAEAFSIVIACGIFMVAWNSRGFLDNNYLMFLGMAYLFVAGMDFVHTLAYRGMGVFEGYGTDLPTRLWIAARYMEAVSLFTAPIFIGRVLNIRLLFSCYAAVFTLLLLSIFQWDIFPVCFVEGEGLTTFKKASEYIISLILAASLAQLVRKRDELDRTVFRLMAACILVTIASELAFTFYVHAYGLSNLVGHYFKIVSFFLIYLAIIETCLVRPYSLLFRNLKRSEENLRRAGEELERRVEERTADLRRLSVRFLDAQEEERKLVALDLHDGIGQSLSAIKFRVENALHEMGERKTKGVPELLQGIAPMVQGAVEDVRRIQKNLRPPSLDDLGILPTISWFCREFEETYYGIRVDKRIDIREDDVPEPLKIVLFRIMQEAMNNAAKYARADSVGVTLQRSGSEIRMSVADNGAGFDKAEAVGRPHEERGLGLSGMKERASLSGGTFSIESARGEGTTVRAAWPLDAQGAGRLPDE